MTPELTALAVAGLVQVVQFCLYSVAANLQVGTKTAVGPRDTHIALTGTAGRLQRALNNHFEGLILFTLAIVVVTLGQASSGLTQICAWIYVIARIAYVPAYVSGIPALRSAIWMVGFGATALMIVSVLL
ncbi:MAG: MAPEG family protein [Pseudomonadota bacterium]